MVSANHSILKVRIDAYFLRRPDLRNLAGSKELQHPAVSELPAPEPAAGGIIASARGDSLISHMLTHMHRLPPPPLLSAKLPGQAASPYGTSCPRRRGGGERVHDCE